MNDNKVMIKMHKTAITQLSTIELMAKTDWFFCYNPMGILVSNLNAIADDAQTLYPHFLIESFKIP